MAIVTSFCGLCLLLVIGKTLRVKIKVLQRLYIPSAVIGGILGLILIQLTGDTASIAWTRGWSELPGFLINIVFAGLGTVCCGNRVRGPISWIDFQHS